MTGCMSAGKWYVWMLTPIGMGDNVLQLTRLRRVPVVTRRGSRKMTLTKAPMRGKESRASVCQGGE